MIWVEGRRWGTAAQVAAALGPDIKPGTVHKWGRRDGLSRYRTRDENGRPQVLYPFDEAAAIEAVKRLGGFGRPRELDIETPQAT